MGVLNADLNYLLNKMANRKQKLDRIRICWVENCNEEIEKGGSFLCEKHRRMELKGHYLRLKVPSIKGFDNTPTKT